MLCRSQQNKKFYRLSDDEISSLVERSRNLDSQLADSLGLSIQRDTNGSTGQ